jgi:hypothetical protein
MVRIILENIQMKVLMWSNKEFLIWSNRDLTFIATCTELEILLELDLKSIWGGEKASLLRILPRYMVIFCTEHTVNGPIMPKVPRKQPSATTHTSEITCTGHAVDDQ